jgi:putative transposase
MRILLNPQEENDVRKSRFPEEQIIRLVKEAPAEAARGGAVARQPGAEGRLGKKVVKPQGRGRLVSFFQEAFGLSRRRACGLAQISRSESRSKRADDTPLSERILAWARERTRYGYRRIHTLLRREGWAVNRKRVYRIYREEALSVRRRKRKQVAASPRQAMPVPARANGRWSIGVVALWSR